MCYDSLESCGKLTPIAFNILDAGPAKPCCRENDSKIFFTRFKSTSTGLESSSSFVSSKSTREFTFSFSLSPLSGCSGDAVTPSAAWLDSYKKKLGNIIGY